MPIITVELPELGTPANIPGIKVDQYEGSIHLTGTGLDGFSVDLTLEVEEARTLAAVLYVQADAADR